MNDATRRDFLQALGLTPLLALLLAAKKPEAAPSPSATPPSDPDDALKEVRAFSVPEATEPAGVFVALRGGR